MVVFDELAEALESALSVVPQAAMESNMAALSARAAMDLNFTAIIVFFFLLSSLLLPNIHRFPKQRIPSIPNGYDKAVMLREYFLPRQRRESEESA